MRQPFSLPNSGVKSYQDNNAKGKYIMSKIFFKNSDHESFYLEMMQQCKNKDNYHKAFFYIMGLSSETRTHIHHLFNFKEDCIEPDGLHNGWQTSGTMKICRFAFNLWNGYIDGNDPTGYTPESLFCCEFAAFFIEGIKLRYPEYFSII